MAALRSFQSFLTSWPVQAFLKFDCAHLEAGVEERKAMPERASPKVEYCLDASFLEEGDNYFLEELVGGKSWGDGGGDVNKNLL